MDKLGRAPVIPLLPRRGDEVEPLGIVPLDPYDPIGDIAHRLGVSRKTAQSYYSRALRGGRDQPRPTI